MSDEPLPQNQPDEINGGWSMPEPVFRSSEGHTPKAAVQAFEGDEHETEVPHGDDVDEFAETFTGVTLDTAETEPTENQIRALPPKKKGGCAKNFVFILGMIGFGVVAIVATLVYFLYYYRAAETTF